MDYTLEILKYVGKFHPLVLHLPIGSLLMTFLLLVISRFQKAGLENVRVFMNINNVYTWADEYIKPFDPESISGPHAAGWIYPITRSFNFGINVNF